MKNIMVFNSELLEVLVANGINITCDIDMETQVTDEEAERIPEIIEECAPDAWMDYVLEK